MKAGFTWRWRSLSWSPSPFTNEGLVDTSSLAAVVPILFPLLWIEQWWVDFNRPFGFAGDTSAIKAGLDPENATAGLWRKLSAYPEATARLAPWIALLCAAAAAYVLLRRVPWWPFVALVAGEAVLLVVVSAGFSNLGPGAERYLLSNLILMFPVLAAAVMLLPRPALSSPERWSFSSRLAVEYRRCSIRLRTIRMRTCESAADVAHDWFGQHQAPLADQQFVPVLLPEAPADGFNASYAFRILGGHPDEWVFTSDPQLFLTLATSGRAPFWVLDTSVGVDPPPSSTSEQVGRFLLGVPAGQALRIPRPNRLTVAA